MKPRQDVQPRVVFEPRLLFDLGDWPEFLGQDERFSFLLPAGRLGEQLVAIALEGLQVNFLTLTGQNRRLPVMSRRYWSSLVVPMNTHCRGRASLKRAYAARPWSTDREANAFTFDVSARDSPSSSQIS